MWRGKSISVILPTYNEKDSIYQSIRGFVENGVVDEILVVNNNAAPGTSEEVARTEAREVLEPCQGYGSAIQRGLREATGDYLVICEPDGTFLARDVYKLLAFADDFDVVFGSRTARMFIWHGANMGLFLRWGNWAVAKMMEFLFNATNLTDVGCTMRLLGRRRWHGFSRIHGRRQRVRTGDDAAEPDRRFKGHPDSGQLSAESRHVLSDW